MHKAIFLDRDGVLNVDHGYTSKVEQFDWIPGIKDACAQLSNMGFKLVVISNQSGIGRGFYTEDEFNQLTWWMCKELEKTGAGIAGVYFCPHHPEKALGEYRKACNCRKPNPGMIIRAAQEHKLDIANSWFVGDKESDMSAAITSGIPNRILVRTGKTVTDGAIAAATMVLNSLADLPAYIIKETS